MNSHRAFYRRPGNSKFSAQNNSIRSVGGIVGSNCQFTWFLSLTLDNNQLNASAIHSILNSIGQPTAVRLNMPGNTVTELVDTVDGELLETLDLSENGLTLISGDALNPAENLLTFLLAGNDLTVVPSALQSYALNVRNISVAGNRILAFPLSGNRLVDPSTTKNNPLACDTLIPTPTNCSCTSSAFPHRSTHCGYVRCTAEPNGCAAGTLFNTSDCSLAPWSSCIPSNALPPGTYYDVFSQTFQPLTACDQAFSVKNGSYLAAYEYSNATATSDRQCSICSACPAGYKVTPCTATTDSTCTKELSVADVASIVLAIVVVLGVGVSLSVFFYREKERQRSAALETADSLELTAQMLAQERFEVERMGQAWKIAETDLTFGQVIGRGGCGQVFRGTWG